MSDYGDDMISLNRIALAIQYKEDIKRKKGISELTYVYESKPELRDREIAEFVASHKKETEVLVKKIREFLIDLSNKGMPDNKLSNIEYEVLAVLEPPVCRKNHCQHHTTSGFCNCREGLVPSRCKEHREYMDRKAKRENKTPGKYFPEKGSRVTLVTWKGDRTGVIGDPVKVGGKWQFPFLMDGHDSEMIVHVDEITSIRTKVLAIKGSDKIEL